MSAKSEPVYAIVPLTHNEFHNILEGLVYGEIEFKKSGSELDLETAAQMKALWTQLVDKYT